MSSLRNAVKRVTHKERSQPQKRRKLGLLEKHSDYVERANDYKKKQSHIKNLKIKAEQRNPDEFYFKMISTEMKDGKHQEIEDRNKELDPATLQLLKTQDLGYLTHKKAVDDKKIEKLRSGLHLIGAVLPRHHIFCESEEQVETFDPATHFQTHPELVHRAYNRPRIDSLEETLASSAAIEPLKTTSSSSSSSSKPLTEKTRKKLLKQVSSSYDELSKRVRRRDKLARAVQELQLQRHLMGKGTKRKVVEVKERADGSTFEKTSYVWKRERAK